MYDLIKKINKPVGEKPGNDEDVTIGRGLTINTNVDTIGKTKSIGKRTTTSNHTRRTRIENTLSKLREELFSKFERVERSINEIILE